MDKWQSRAVDTLKEIMCYCCHCNPAYLMAIRVDSLLMITELHRERFQNYTPPTQDYTRLCTLLQRIVMTADAPLPDWATSQRRSQRARKPTALMNESGAWIASVYAQ